MVRVRVRVSVRPFSWIVRLEPYYERVGASGACGRIRDGVRMRLLHNRG